MKIIYLLPPSEGKNVWWVNEIESLSFDFKKPLDIARHATQKDLKCSWKRYMEGIEFNKNIKTSKLLPAISRYSWVMYNYIDYTSLNQWWKKYFEENFLIFSGMYGILKAQDLIWNYKLPIETKWLYTYWGTQITDLLNNLKVDYIVDLLPASYAKMVDFKTIETKIVRINFFHTKEGKLKKISHGVKKIKWEYIKNICKNWYINLEDFPWEKVTISKNEYHINIISE